MMDKKAAARAKPSRSVDGRGLSVRSVGKLPFAAAVHPSGAGHERPCIAPNSDGPTGSWGCVW